MPIRVRLAPNASNAGPVPGPQGFPALTGLSEMTSGEWASWEKSAEGAVSPQPVLGVQRDVATLSDMAAQLPALIQSSHGNPSARPDEGLVEWYSDDQSTAVDLTIVLAILGRDLDLTGFAGSIALEGT